MDKQELANRWKAARERARKTQEEIGAALDIARSAVSAIETGFRDISALELYAFAQAVDVPIEYFLPSTDRYYWQTLASELQDKMTRIAAIIAEE